MKFSLQGKGFSLGDFERAIEDLAKHPGSIYIFCNGRQPVAVLISVHKMCDLLAESNERMAECARIAEKELT